MDAHEDERLRRRLRQIVVPEHGRDFRLRREQALAAAAASAAGQGFPSSALSVRRRRLFSTRVLLIAAATAIGLAATIFALALATAGSDNGAKVGSAPSLAPTHAGRIVAGPAPEAFGDELTGMVRGLDGTLWAWGYRHRLGRRGSPLLEVWDGQRWQTVATPGVEIEGVAALSRDDVWVALNTRHSGQLAHWDGVTWTTVPAFAFAATSETSNALLALSPSDIWAVGCAEGGRGHSGTVRTLHWNGRSWRSVPAPAPGRGGDEIYLRLLRGSSPQAVWALGYQLLRWDGRRWSRQSWPTRQLASGAKDRIAIDDLAVAGDGELWCVGRRWFGPDNVGDLYVPIVLRLQGGRWQIMASSAAASLPPDWKAFMPISVALSSPEDIWVAGNTDTSGGVKSSLWHWDGSAWNVITLSAAIPPQSFGPRTVLAIAADDVWVLFNGGTQLSDKLVREEPFFLHFDGTAWQRVPAAPFVDAQ